MDPQAQGLDFLDWSEIPDKDRQLLHHILFGGCDEAEEGPGKEEEWIEEDEGVEEGEEGWEQQPQEYEEVNDPVEVQQQAPPPSRQQPQQHQAMAPQTVPIYQQQGAPNNSTPMMPSMSQPIPPQQSMNSPNFPLVLSGPTGLYLGNVNLSVNANVQGFMPLAYHQNQQQYAHENYDATKEKDRRRGSNKMNKPKREYKMPDDQTNPNMGQYPHQYVYQHHAQHSYESYLPHTAAQHVSGSPLFLTTTQMPMYPNNPPPHAPLHSPHQVYYPQQMYLQSHAIPIMADHNVENLPQTISVQEAHRNYSIPPPVSPQASPVPPQVQPAPPPVQQVPVPVQHIPSQVQQVVAPVQPVAVPSQQAPVLAQPVPVQTQQASLPIATIATPVETVVIRHQPPPEAIDAAKKPAQIEEAKKIITIQHQDVPTVSDSVAEVKISASPKPVEPIPQLDSVKSEIVEVVKPQAKIEPPTPPKPVTPQPLPAKSWASIVQSSNPPVVPQEISTTPKPLARVNPFTPLTPNVSEASPLTKSKTPSISSDLNGPTIDDPLLFRLGEYLSTYQLDHRSTALQPRGLTNRSNWCYVNATLQALLACPPLYNLMRNLPVRISNRGQQKAATTKSSTPIIDAVVEFVNEFNPLPPGSRPLRKEKIMARKDDSMIMDVPQGPPFEPTCVYSMLGSIRSAAFKVEGRQEDAEEFLSCLLNGLNDEMLELVKIIEDTNPKDDSSMNGEEITTNGDAHSSADEEGHQWTVMRSKNRSCVTRHSDFGRTPISDIFRGQLCSHVQRKGDQQTENVQPFFTLQLDIEKAQSVNEALEQLVDRDWLEGVKCSRTQQQVEAWQQVTLEQLPPVLLLHLKWFHYKPDGGCTKIMKSVDYSVDLKIEHKLMSSSKQKYTQKQRTYKLFAVVYHDGKEASKGHYITDVYHSTLGMWVRYDDSQVRVVPEHVVLRPHLPSVPYILYYRRSDTMGQPSPKSASANEP